MSVNSVDRQLINDFLYVLRNTKDDKKDMHKIMEFLSVVLRYKKSVPPTVEIVTILKHQKPVLFQFLKNSISPSSPKHLIVQLEMDYETALQRLNLVPDDLPLVNSVSLDNGKLIER